MRRIVWSAKAVSNLDSIVEYVSAFNPSAAQRLADRIIRLVETLAEHPDRGRLARTGAREVVAITPYLIRYRVTDEAIVVLRVRHGARFPD